MSGDVILTKKRIVYPGETLIVQLPSEQEQTAPLSQKIPLDIRYEDEHLLVVNKPAGMVVHPAPGNSDGTLVNALLAYCGGQLSAVGDSRRPGIVHRIDKDTSGLLIVAKTDEAHKILSAQIKDHSFLREYEAVLYGRLKQDNGIIDAPVGRHPVKRKQMAVLSEGGRRAVTRYEVIDRYARYSHVRAQLETGRTHQLRVHFAHLGYPVAGDPIYAGKRKAPGLTAQCLHAKRIAFTHPVTGNVLDISCELPEWFTAFLGRLGLPDSRDL